MLGSGDFEMRSNYCLKKLSVVTERNEGKRNRQEVNFNSTLTFYLVIPQLEPISFRNAFSGPQAAAETEARQGTV